MVNKQKNKQNAGTWLRTDENELDHRGANFNGQIWHIPFLLYFSISTRKTKSLSFSSFSSFCLQLLSDRYH